MGQSEYNQTQPQVHTKHTLLAHELYQSPVHRANGVCCILKEDDISLDLEFVFFIPDALAASTIQGQKLHQLGSQA